VKAIYLQYYSLYYDQKCYSFIIELGLENMLILPGVSETCIWERQMHFNSGKCSVPSELCRRT